VESDGLGSGSSLQDVLRRINESVDDFASRPARSANDRGAFEDYPLHKVAIWGDIEAARVLLDNGADINALGEDGDTPLHRAIAGDQTEMAEFLVARGADVTIRNRYGVAAGERT
jgi:uncharacterized protein